MEREQTLLTAPRARARVLLAACAVLAAAALGAPAPASAQDYSGSCSSPLAQVFDGYAGGSTYVKLRVQPDPADPKTTWICYRVSNGGSLEQGGRIDVSSGSATADPPSADANSGLCSTTPGNAVPGSHPVFSGSVGDPNDPPYVPFALDAYANSGEAWICAEVGDFKQRVVVPVPEASAPTVVNRPDAPAPALLSPTPGPAGYPSSSCQQGLFGTPQQHLNADVGQTHVWAYTAQPMPARAHVCARLQGPVSGGGMLTLDASSSPGITPTVEGSNDTSPCTINVVTLTQPVQASARRSPSGASPASVCVSSGSTSQRLTVGASGSPSAPTATWTPDPGTPG